MLFGSIRDLWGICLRLFLKWMDGHEYHASSTSNLLSNIYFDVTAIMKEMKKGKAIAQVEDGDISSIHLGDFGGM